MLDVIHHYFPTVEELRSEDIKATRVKVANYLRRLRPELDMSSGSVFGDLALDPFAELLTATSIAFDRFQSDLKLENIANGTIYHCDFVRAYLKLFTADYDNSKAATGVVRFTFNTNAYLVIPRNTLLSFGGNLPEVFNVRTFAEGDIHILPVGLVDPSKSNSYTLSEVGANRWVVDLPLEGYSLDPVLEGATAALAEEIPNLLEVRALQDFTAGTQAESLPDLAGKARATVYSATPNTALGVMRFVRKEFPIISGVSAILSGDVEMTRDTTNALGISEGKLTVFGKSNTPLLRDTVTVALAYIEEQNDEPVNRLVGIWNPPSIPYAVEDVKIVSATGGTFTISEGAFEIVSKSKAPREAPLTTCAISEFEQLYIVVEPPAPDGLDGGFVPSVDGEGNRFSYVTIQYLTDPALAPLSRCLMGRNNRLVNTSTLVRGYNLIYIEELRVRYAKADGIHPNLEGAREEIYKYLTQTCYPNVYTDSRIIDCMYFARVHSVVDIQCDAKLLWGAATCYLPANSLNPLQDTNAALAAALRPADVSVARSDDFLLAFTDPDIGTEAQTMETSSFRNIAYHIERQNIKFVEVKF